MVRPGQIVVSVETYPRLNGTVRGCSLGRVDVSSTASADGQGEQVHHGELPTVMRRPVAASVPQRHDAADRPRRTRCFARALAHRRLSSSNPRWHRGVQNSCGRPPERRGEKTRPHCGRPQTLGPNPARCATGLLRPAGAGIGGRSLSASAPLTGCFAV